MEKKSYSAAGRKEESASPSKRASLRLATVTKKKDFDRAFRQGKKVSSSVLQLRYALNDLTENRVACMVSQKVSKKAVVRNKIRRRLIEITRTAVARNNANGVDLIFVTLPGIEKKEFSELKEMLSQYFLKIPQLQACLNS
jgi:ribonuclease P protein component